MQGSDDVNKKINASRLKKDNEILIKDLPSGTLKKLFGEEGSDNYMGPTREASDLFMKRNLELRINDPILTGGGDRYVGTLLHLAVQTKNTEVVKILVENGADPNASSGWIYDKTGTKIPTVSTTPFFDAIQYGASDEIIQLLLDAGANYKVTVHLEDDSKFTPLDYLMIRDMDPFPTKEELVDLFDLEKINPDKNPRCIPLLNAIYKEMSENPEFLKDNIVETYSGNKDIISDYFRKAIREFSQSFPVDDPEKVKKWLEYVKKAHSLVLEKTKNKEIMDEPKDFTPRFSAPKTSSTEVNQQSPQSTVGKDPTPRKP